MAEQGKLMTEAELRSELAGAGVADWRINNIVKGFKEKGLIAPEPEPEPLVEIELKAALECCREFQSDYGKVAWGNGFRVGFARGMELGRSDPVRPELTRERVREACVQLGYASSKFVDRLHAALINEKKEK